MSKGKRKAEGCGEADTSRESRKRVRTTSGQIAGGQDRNSTQELVTETVSQDRTSPDLRQPKEEAKTLRKKAKSEKRMLKKTNKAAHLQEPGLGSKTPGDTEATIATLPKKRAKKVTPKDADMRWSVSSAIGGFLRDLDPVFSIDEQSVIIPLI